MIDARRVFESVSRCPNVRACYDTASPNPCREIVDNQKQQWDAETYERFQVPVPWVGRIDKARILFVASNPSISGDDDHARVGTNDDIIWESHHLAFGGGSRPYIIDGIKTTNDEGRPGHMVRYWCSIRARAREVLPGSIPGEDYAITEIVHCKSRREIGVPEAADECFGRHFDNVMSVAKAPLVVALGAVAAKRFLNGSAAHPSTPIECEYGGRKRTIIFLPHPSSFVGPKSIGARYPDSLAALQSLVKAD
jgi:uracil-DNA glycosylase